MTAKLSEVTDPAVLVDPSTPQGQARLWLLNDDPAAVDPCTYPTLHQRYALSTFFYSMNGEDWINNTSWLEGEHECNWTHLVCDPNEMLEEMELGKYLFVLYEKGALTR